MYTNATGTYCIVYTVQVSMCVYQYNVHVYMYTNATGTYCIVYTVQVWVHQNSSNSA